MALAALTACSSARMSIPVQQVGTFNAAERVFPSEATLVVHDQQSWLNLWSQMARNRVPTPPAPAVDFTQNMLLVAAAGDRPTGGFSVAITEVTQVGGGLAANVTVTSPGSNCVVTQAITSPVQVVSIPRSNMAVNFQVRQEIRNC